MPELFNRLNQLLGLPVRGGEPKPEKDPIIGYRAWIANETPEGLNVLRSMSTQYTWPPHEAAESIGLQGLKPTDKNTDGMCEAGIYAVKELSLIDSYGMTEVVFGEVYLWGTVVEHQDGYRAEFAYPKQLWVRDDFPVEVMAKLEETYGVPISVNTDLPKPSRFSHFAVAALEILNDCLYDREALDGQYTALFVNCWGMSTRGTSGERIVKDRRYTNCICSGMLPAPNKMLVRGIRCSFFEDGKLLPITDRIYWDCVLEFTCMQKAYWRSPAAFAADPVVVFSATDWSKVPEKYADNLINKVYCSLHDPKALSVAGIQTFGNNDGVLLEQQMPFQVRVEAPQYLADQPIEVLVGLMGTGFRAIQ